MLRPNTIDVHLQPDITAPGVNILAAYTEAKGPTDLQSDDRRLPFHIVSGTSMSCPHVSGIVGLLKKIHPDWSPSTIRSTIMTTGQYHMLNFHQSWIQSYIVQLCCFKIIISMNNCCLMLTTIWVPART